MRFSRSAQVYTALALGAIAALGFLAVSRIAPQKVAVQAAAVAPAVALSGDMKKLIFHAAPQPVPDVAFAGADGTAMQLADFAGKHVLLNFWASWCAPCREEMPMLADLETKFGGEDFAVVTIATGRDDAAKVDRFFDGMGITNLPRHRDTNQALARQMQVF
ncbi:MAG TPA: TlpA disulfide reductase family protein, partial [Paracoccaceae bacterium]|nr:TlpA disulfide reductase family protein [Paracoccaceae bacterium]